MGALMLSAGQTSCSSMPGLGVDVHIHNGRPDVCSASVRLGRYLLPSPSCSIWPHIYMNVATHVYSTKRMYWLLSIQVNVNKRQDRRHDNIAMNACLVN